MRYSLSNVFGDPFWLTTIPMAIVGWVVALAGSILTSSLNSSQFPVFSWWGLAFEMLAILLTLHVAFSNQIRMYRLVTLSFLSIATIYTTNNTNNFVWRENSSSGTAAAGNILLSIINLVWIMYLGTTQDEPVHTYLDSFAAYKKTSRAQSEFHQRMRERRKRMMMNGGGLAGTGIGAISSGAQAAAAQQLANSTRVPPPNRADESNLRGTKSNPYRMSDTPNSLRISGPTDFNRQTDSMDPSNANNPQLENPLHSTYLYSVEQLNRHGLSGHEVEQLSRQGLAPEGEQIQYSRDTAMPEDPYFEDNESGLIDNMETIAKARARFSYVARVSEGELSFTEGEVLDVCDMSGNWWCCKRSNGDYGICPKNYLELVGDSLL